MGPVLLLTSTCAWAGKAANSRVPLNTTRTPAEASPRTTAAKLSGGEMRGARQPGCSRRSPRDWADGAAWMV